MFGKIRQFISDEQITFWRLCNPVFVIRLLHKTKYLHFFIIGVSGVLLSLGLTAFFAEFIFGRERYFDAYLIGLIVGLIYLFVLHTIITFQTKEKHVRRFIWFFCYSIAMSAFQAFLVKTITPLIGIDYYLLVIASIIFIFSTVTFTLFKLVLFNERKANAPTSS